MNGRKKEPPKRYACTRCSKLRVKCVPLTTEACQRCTRLGHPSGTCIFPAEIRGSPTPTLTLTSTTRTPTSKAASNLIATVNLRNVECNQEKEVLFHPAITSHLANALLSKYITHKQLHFPFVIIQPGTTVTALFRKSPFLLLCVLTASLEYDTRLQDELESVVRKEIAARVVVGVERDLDILQGLLVHAAWYQYHWRTYHTHGYMLLQMAVMVVVDLGLDRVEGFRMKAIPVDEKEAMMQGLGQLQME
ncbi:Zn(II)2Cys6 transcription factor [Aspergillus undulatus]|uniref:Zn(II)2Cys6 transcription factor n=1 Tax=Aspergillus undulatus TaxID=1810928 RepID=UPI003CCDE9D2